MRNKPLNLNSLNPWFINTTKKLIYGHGLAGLALAQVDKTRQCNFFFLPSGPARAIVDPIFTPRLDTGQK